MTPLDNLPNLARISHNQTVTVQALANQSITINLPLAKNGYSINVGYNLLTQLTEVCPELVNKEILVVTSEQVGSLYLEQVLANLKSQALKLEVVLVPNGETAKTQHHLDRIYYTLLQHNYSRSCVIVALGGGTVGDLAGFAAATYLRGVNVIQVPTTLLAQVDASIGGKTAIDHPLGKNMIGAFHQPKRVVIDLNVLATLDSRDLYAGMGEIVKYGFIMDNTFLTWLDHHILNIYDLIPQLHINSLDSSSLLDARRLALLDMIASCCFYKAQVILADELEKTGQRALLNFGHTYGHAIESHSNYLLPHGECVAMGMVLAFFLSYNLQHSTNLTEPQDLANQFYQYLIDNYQQVNHNLQITHKLQVTHNLEDTKDQQITNHFTGFSLQFNQQNPNFTTITNTLAQNLLTTNSEFNSQDIGFVAIYQGMRLIAKCRLPLFFPVNMEFEDFMTYVMRDKKVDSGKLAFITLDYLGKAQLHKGIKAEIVAHTIATVKALVKLMAPAH